MKEELQNKVQIIFCKEQKHWVVATTINCDKNEVAVYDSLFAFLDKESKQIVENLFTCDNVKPTIKMVKCQRQKVLKIVVCMPLQLLYLLVLAKSN